MVSPYLIGIIVQYPSGTVLANVNVTLREEDTNERYTLTSNSAGETIFNLGDANQFPSGFTRGDTVSWSVLYQNFEQHGSFVIPVVRASATAVTDDWANSVGSKTGGGITATIVLQAITAATQLRYFKAQQFLDFFDLQPYGDNNSKGIKLNRVIDMGVAVETEIDNACNTKFDNNDGSYYSQTDYLKGKDTFDKDYFLTKRPVISITSIKINSASEGATESFGTELTANTDYALDSNTGKTKIFSETEIIYGRERAIEAIYTYGRATVPEDIRQLAIIMTGMKMFGSSALQSRMVGGKSDITTADIVNFDAYKERVYSNYRSRMDNT